MTDIEYDYEWMKRWKQPCPECDSIMKWKPNYHGRQWGAFVCSSCDNTASRDEML